MRLFSLFVSKILLRSVHAEIALGADPRVPVKDGSEFWLDATRENEAREAPYMNRLSNGDRVEVWQDSSGRDRLLE